jgi:hypothetical protein
MSGLGRPFISTPRPLRDLRDWMEVGVGSAAVAAASAGSMGLALGLGNSEKAAIIGAGLGMGYGLLRGPLWHAKPAAKRRGAG